MAGSQFSGGSGSAPASDTRGPGGSIERDQSQPLSVSTSAGRHTECAMSGDRCSPVSSRLESELMVPLDVAPTPASLPELDGGPPAGDSDPRSAPRSESSPESSVSDMPGSSVRDRVPAPETLVSVVDAPHTPVESCEVVPRRSTRASKPPERLVLRFFTESF